MFATKNRARERGTLFVTKGAGLKTSRCEARRGNEKKKRTLQGMHQKKVGKPLLKHQKEEVKGLS